VILTFKVLSLPSLIIHSKPILIINDRSELHHLRGHRKTGQRWSLQNRPTEVARD
jgi:hypothetical protein